MLVTMPMKCVKDDGAVFYEMLGSKV